MAKLPVPAVFSSVIAALGAITAGIFTARATAAMKRRDDRREARQATLQCDRHGRLPYVRELTNPIQLGVHPAVQIESFERVPVFVRRDVMETLVSTIKNDHFVLIVGESTAGKSRAAYEAIHELLPDHRLIVPGNREAVGVAIAAILDSSRSVLWLDDIERYLGEGGLNGAAISSILSGRCHKIVATMRSEEFSYFCGGSANMADATRSRETIRQGWEVLRLASRIDLRRSWSSHEVRRAQLTQPEDPRITEALKHVNNFGVAEFLAAGPQLLATWRDAWAPGTHPRGAALVLAAVDARRAGMHRPLPLEMLTRAHEQYLHSRGGHQLRPESVAEAIDWATTPLHATSSLLIPSDKDTFIAFDYLIDAIEREVIPAGSFHAFIEVASPQELKDIGQAAWDWGRLEQADLAFARASSTFVESRANRGYVIFEDDGEEAFEAYLHQSIEDMTNELGRDHEDTVMMRSLVAWDSPFDQMRLSLRRLIEVRKDAERAIGPLHRTTLNIRRGIAHRMGEVGEQREAAGLFLRLFEDCLENLDESEWLTYAVFFSYAHYVGTQATPERALDLLSEFEVWMRTRRAPADSFNSLKYHRACQLRNAGRYQHALCELESIAIDAELANGRHHGRALSARSDWLELMATHGDQSRALQFAYSLLNDSKSHSTPECNLYYLRKSISSLEGELGSADDAIKTLTSLRTEMLQRWHKRDFRVNLIDYRIRYWVAVKHVRSGDLLTAVDEFRSLSEDVLIARGATSEIRRWSLAKLNDTVSQLRKEELGCRRGR
ncbi:hypothetical protein [Amycolatopsis sp. 195334CR]|uniref:hypothetical protein n=1 Tax=Amycolatopsis sp. 195334CR TaxID=2814588 RepID=UPI001A8FD42D|nr:hypothetical protein [Amycolatopsis sp. 195334CR]MBN6040349.1 hypothetical protein [Amycolatopsis sp. 195334CR]